MKGISTQFNQFRFLFAFLLMVGMTSQVGAVAKTWVGGASGNVNNWNTAANWNTSGVPGTNDDVTIPTGLTNYPILTATATNTVKSITISTGGTLTMNASGSLTTSGALAVAGTLVINAGTLACKDFSGAGTMTISGGILKISNDFKPTPASFNPTGGLVEFTGNSGAGAFTSSSTYNFFNVQVDGSSDPGFDNAGGAISIAGTLTILASGTAKVVNTFSVTGATSISGTLTFSNNTGTKTFGGLITIPTGGSWANSGNSNITLKGGITKVGTLTAGTGLYTLNTSDQSLTGSMTINNITVTSVVLTIPSGTTLTSTGTITNNGTISNEGVIAKTGGYSNGSTYKSAAGITGSFTGSLFTNAGSLSPGGSIGSLSFSAGLTNSGTINMEVDGTTIGTYDQIIVTGAAATLGGTLNVISALSSGTDFTIDILTAPSISGTFASVIVPDAHWTVSYPAGVVKLTYSAVLPVELTKFTANTEGAKTKLSWQTASEFNTKNFDIERSADGTSFEKIGEVNAYGKPNDYSFMDELPIVGLNYYRLKTNDFDGKTNFSKTASVVFSGKTGKTKVYPNPVGTEGVLRIEADSDIQNVTITNAIGQVVLTSKLSNINVSQLPSGFYYATVQVNNDRKTEKFFKQ